MQIPKLALYTFSSTSLLLSHLPHFTLASLCYFYWGQVFAQCKLLKEAFPDKPILNFNAPNRALSSSSFYALFFSITLITYSTFYKCLKPDITKPYYIYRVSPINVHTLTAGFYYILKMKCILIKLPLSLKCLHFGGYCLYVFFLYILTFLLNQLLLTLQEMWRQQLISKCNLSDNFYIFPSKHILTFT